MFKVSVSPINTKKNNLQKKKKKKKNNTAIRSDVVWLFP